MPYALCDSRISENCRAALLREGFEVIALPPAKGLSEPIASHTDMLLFSHADTLITTKNYRASCREIFDKLEICSSGTEFIYADEDFSPEYPSDAILNALCIGNKIFLRAESCSRSILGYAQEHGLEIIPVKQGYPACVALGLKESAITSDEGLACAMRAAGIRVTLIKNSESIHLPPYGYGFIGGAAGVKGDKVYFLGDLNSHPDSEIIKQAIASEGLIPCSLDPTADGLADLGGIRFLG